MPRVSPHLAFSKVYKKEDARQCSVYFTRGIAKRPTRNKQSTPTPYRYIDTPCRGVDIRQVRAFTLLTLRV